MQQGGERPDPPKRSDGGQRAKGKIGSRSGLGFAERWGRLGGDAHVNQTASPSISSFFPQWAFGPPLTIISGGLLAQLCQRSNFNIKI